jgi:hypothetical protein
MYAEEAEGVLVIVTKGRWGAMSLGNIITNCWKSIVYARIWTLYSESFSWAHLPSDLRTA